MILDVLDDPGDQGDGDVRGDVPVGASSWHAGVRGCTLAGLGELKLEALAICRREWASEHALNVVLQSWQT